MLKSKNLNLPNRRSIRLKSYDYSQKGLYFVTICCKNNKCLFGHVEGGEMVLNEFGKIAYTEWENTGNVRDNVCLHEFVIMPNHIHGIIEIIFKKGEGINKNITAFKSPSQTIGSIIRGYKIATIKKIKDYILQSAEELHRTGELQFARTSSRSAAKIKSLDFKIWHRNYYEHIIRHDRAYHHITEYIIHNPEKWKDDVFYGL